MLSDAADRLPLFSEAGESARVLADTGLLLSAKAAIQSDSSRIKRTHVKVVVVSKFPWALQLGF